MSTRPGIRELDRARVLLGCLRHGQASSLHSDALNRLVDRLHYLNSSGGKAQDATRHWFDARANLGREMEVRKRRFDDRAKVHGGIAAALKKAAGGAASCDGVHVFTPYDETAAKSSVSASTTNW